MLPTAIVLIWLFLGPVDLGTKILYTLHRTYVWADKTTIGHRVVYDVLSNDTYIGTFSSLMGATTLVSEHPLLELDIKEREVNWIVWAFWKLMR